jgi:hypothetical protein
MKKFLFYAILFCSLVNSDSVAQQKGSKNLIYIDAQGIMRYSKDGKEAAFFGVNYTTPFAYGYRSHKQLGVDLEKAIDADVYHFSRLGLDAFRVHVWDTEITDSLGNLNQNEHLRLFDYLIKKLKERKIKIVLTPLAFWGNGYPEKDENTGSFSSIYNKEKVLVTEAAIKAQENYLAQLLKHVNPFTNLTYENDMDIIALEINNEPKHTGTKKGAGNYIDRMVKAVKSAGWSKPVFYNISESPAYADVVANASIDGVSFQWYPTGLVANRSLEGNYLPNVDHYKIPFGDTIPAFKNKAKMVYEFDAGDVYESYMYPAMARSFRSAGFQWATQFAYDPLATAYANTEYQTHYLNLAYTPSKAISLLIASKVFHKVPRLKNYGTYPTDTLFDAFRVSYKEQLSEMNSEAEFYYSASTSTKPINSSTLKHIAGVGNSPIIQYEGTGAYFLDKISEDSWRLEVMPDAIKFKDPFEKASLNKAVTEIIWKQNKMQLQLPSLAENFNIEAIDKDNKYNVIVSGNQFLIQPGVYLVSKKGHKGANHFSIANTFFAPKNSSSKIAVIHHPFKNISEGKPFDILAKIIGVDSSAKINVEVHNSSNKWKTLQMLHVHGFDYKTEIPVDLVSPGVINYRIMIKIADTTYITFPGGFNGDPYAWDEYRNKSWQIMVANANSRLEIFNATSDRNQIMLYNPNWRNNTVEYITAEDPNQLVLKASMKKETEQIFGWQYFFGNDIKGRKDELSSLRTIVIKARSGQNTNAKITLITANADAYSTSVSLTQSWQEIQIPLTSLQKDDFLLLPRPYPGFLPLKFKSSGATPFNILEAEKLEISFGDAAASTPMTIEVESVYLKK